MTTLLLGGRIHTPTSPDATAMAVTDGVVAWVGQDGAGRVLYPDAEVVDLAGAFVAPAFVDAHVHATATGLLLDGLDLTGCRSLAELLSTLRRFVATHSGGVLWGHGWDDTTWPEGRPPTRAELDAAAGSVPVYLSRIDVHSALVTTALAATVPAAQGKRGWSADGPVSQQAHHHIRGAARAALTTAQRRAAQEAFLAHAAAHGVAAVHECAGPDISGEDDFTDLLATTTGPEVVGYWGERTDPATAARLGAHGLAGDLFADGALGSRTAALTHPYTDDPTNTGAAYLTAAEIADHVVACTNAGIQAGFHVIGDAAVTAVVDGFAQAAAVVGVPALAARHHRLEHLEMVTADQAAKLGAWGVMASMQPNFDTLWGGHDGMYARRLGIDRAARLNPFALLASQGVALAFGSDAPVTGLDPWATIRAAVNHQTPDSSISARAAFAAATRGGWRAGGTRDELIGSLVPGAPASYAVWDVGEFDVSVPSDAVRRWSTDPRSRVPVLPRLGPTDSLPRCRQTVHRGAVIHG